MPREKDPVLAPFLDSLRTLADGDLTARLTASRGAPHRRVKADEPPADPERDPWDHPLRPGASSSSSAPASSDPSSRWSPVPGFPLPYPGWSPYDGDDVTGPGRSGRRSRNNQVPRELIRQVMVQGVPMHDEAGIMYVYYPTDHDLIRTYGVSADWLRKFSKEENIDRERMSFKAMQSKKVDEIVATQRAVKFANFFQRLGDITELTLQTIEDNIRAGKTRPTPGDAATLVKAMAAIKPVYEDERAAEQASSGTDEFSPQGLIDHHMELRGKGSRAVVSPDVFYGDELDGEQLDIGVMDEPIVQRDDGIYEVAPPPTAESRLSTWEQDGERIARERAEREASAVEPPVDVNAIDPAALFPSRPLAMADLHIDVEPIDSSARFCGIGYDADAMVMHIQELAGDGWRYCVRPADYDAIRTAPSLRQALEQARVAGNLLWETFIPAPDAGPDTDAE